MFVWNYEKPFYLTKVYLPKPPSENLTVQAAEFNGGPSCNFTVENPQIHNDAWGNKYVSFVKSQEAPIILGHCAYKALYLIIKWSNDSFTKHLLNPGKERLVEMLDVGLSFSSKIVELDNEENQICTVQGMFTLLYTSDVKHQPKLVKLCNSA